MPDKPDPLDKGDAQAPPSRPQRRPATPAERGDTALTGSTSVYSNDGHPREQVAGQRRESSSAPPDDNATNRPGTRTGGADIPGLRGAGDDDTPTDKLVEEDEDAFDLRDELGLRNPAKRGSGRDRNDG